MPARPQAHEPVRRCILTGEHGGRDELIRLALGPDGRVLPDLAARAPGRGAWITPDAGLIAEACRTGRLRKALARHLGGGAPAGVSPALPDDLAAAIEAGLRRRGLDRLGLENRAGNLIFGFDRIHEAAASGAARLIVHAGDAGEDGRGKLSAALARRPGGAERTLPVTRIELSLALGRQNVVHAATCDQAAAERIMAAIDRWRAFCGTGGSEAGDG